MPIKFEGRDYAKGGMEKICGDECGINADAGSDG